MPKKHEIDYIKKEFFKKQKIFLDDSYKNSRFNHNVKCLECECKFTISFSNFKRESSSGGCRNCAAKNTSERCKHSLEKVRKDYLKYGHKFLDTIYNGNSHPHLVQCCCGNIVNSRYADFHKRNTVGCNVCKSKKISECRRLSLDQCKIKAIQSGCELLDDEVGNAHDFCNFKCECGKKYKTTWNSFNSKGQNRCRNCTKAISKGEKEIIKILNELLISDKHNWYFQFRIKDCKKIRALPFDFCIIDDNKKYLIEYNGRQHYQLSNFGGKYTIEEQKNNLKIIQNNDKIKYKFAHKNGIPLLIINYNEKSIKEKIIEFLKKNNVF